MESTLNVRKRKLERELVLEKCVICQHLNKGERLRQATSAGRDSFKEALAKRKKYKCDRYAALIDLLDRESVDVGDQSLELKWHKSCFSSFTSSSNLWTVQRQFE